MMIPEPIVIKIIITMLFKYYILSNTFQIKHFIADFLLQGKYMLGKFKEKGWVAPLLAHVGVHGIFTTIISFIVLNNLFLSVGLAILDMSIHFVMDRIKASPKLLGRYEALSKNEYGHIARTLSNPTVDSDPNYPNVRKEYEGMLKSNVKFWWSLGFDQLVHGLTHELVIFLIMLLSMVVR